MLHMTRGSNIRKTLRSESMAVWCTYYLLVTLGNLKRLFLVRPEVEPDTCLRCRVGKETVNPLCPPPPPGNPP